MNSENKQTGDLNELRALIEHWQDDAVHGLPCTKGSINYGHRLVLDLITEHDGMLAALREIERLGSDGEHSGDRHARCREIASAAISRAEGKAS